MPLVASKNLHRLSSFPRKWAIPAHIIAGRRVGGYKYISIQQTPATDTTTFNVNSKSMSVSSPDATFEILGSPYSLLSVTLQPSQDLHTRRGTLVGLSGSPDNVVSSLRILNPIRRALIGIPFLYQKITSTSPVSCLISTKSFHNSFAVLQLDGTTDWKLAQRKALLAWTGKTLSVTPSISRQLSLAYWGSSDITGRGLLALVGQGQIYAIELGQGESYVAHPSSILAYSTSSTTSITPLPQPYRFKSSQVRFSIPLALGNWFPDTQLVRSLKTSNTFKFFQGITLRIKTWSRRTIWGDRLFLRFEGPTTILVQSRAARVSEILTREDINEIADAPAGVTMQTIRRARIAEDAGPKRIISPAPSPQSPTVPQIPGLDRSRTDVQGATISAQTAPVAVADTKLNVNKVAPDGKVGFKATTEEAKDGKLNPSPIKDVK